MNTTALIAVFAFAAVFSLIYGLLYRGASKSLSRGEIDIGGVRMLRLAYLGHLTLFVILAITAFLT